MSFLFANIIRGDIMSNSVKERLKPLACFVFFCLSIALFTAFTNIGTPLFVKAYGILVGLGFMALSVPAHFLGERLKLSYVLSIILNSVGTGFIASSYYCVKQVPSGFSHLIPAVFLPLGITFVCCVILAVAPDIKHPVIAIGIILEVALIIASIVFWCIKGGEFYAFSLFSLIICGFYTVILGVSVGEERKLIKDISFGGFGALMVICVIVVLVLSGGEGCDSCDCDGCDCGGGGKGNKKG